MLAATLRLTRLSRIVKAGGLELAVTGARTAFESRAIAQCLKNVGFLHNLLALDHAREFWGLPDGIEMLVRILMDEDGARSWPD